LPTADLDLNIQRTSAGPAPWRALFDKAMLLGDLVAWSGVNVRWTFLNCTSTADDLTV